jgi:5-bromo-4-chloroindolyl phosphate hydrolysis protein
MSLRDLARELYRAKQQVEQLEKLLLSGLPEEEEMKIRSELEEARAERRQLQKIIDGRKDSSPLPKRF